MLEFSAVALPEPEFWQKKKQLLLADFSAWLNQLDDVPAEAPATPEDAPDLFSLLAGFESLRHDVKLQAKTTHTLNDQLGQLQQRLRQETTGDQQQLAEVLATLRRQLPEARRQATSAVILEYIELYEGIVRTLATPPRPGIFGKRLLDQCHQPLLLLRRRAEDVLRRFRVTTIAEVGKAFDPQCMRAVAINNQAPEGTIAEVSRQGYCLDDEVIRLAEVSVGKKTI